MKTIGAGFKIKQNVRLNSKSKDMSSKKLNSKIIIGLYLLSFEKWNNRYVPVYNAKILQQFYDFSLFVINSKIPTSLKLYLCKSDKIYVL